MGAMRDYQEAAVNKGWRIKVIPYKSQFSAYGNVGTLLGALLFLFSLGGALFVSNEDIQIELPKIAEFYQGMGLSVAYWVGLAVFSMLLSLAAIFIKNSKRKLRWPVVKAKIIDKELGKILSRSSTDNSSSRSYVWVWRLLCEYEYKGREYKVTPEPSWLSFGEESRATEDLDKIIDHNGRIEL